MSDRGKTGSNFVHMLKRCRHSCRSWAKKIGPNFQREHDTNVLLHALDLLEEERPLTPAESTLRRLATSGLQLIHDEKLAFWQQRFNIRLSVDWDENSRFFHATASGRRRKNAIPCLDHEGTLFYSHDSKSDILHAFYKALLGTIVPSSWDFELRDLYPSSAPLMHLSAPFT